MGRVIRLGNPADSRGESVARRGEEIILQGRTNCTRVGIRNGAPFGDRLWRPWPCRAAKAVGKAYRSGLSPLHWGYRHVSDLRTASTSDVARTSSGPLMTWFIT
jgi:hypothetical protein